LLTAGFQTLKFSGAMKVCPAVHFLNELFCKIYNRMGEEYVLHLTFVLLCKYCFSSPVNWQLGIVLFYNKDIQYCLAVILGHRQTSTCGGLFLVWVSLTLVVNKIIRIPSFRQVKCRLACCAVEVKTKLPWDNRMSFTKSGGVKIIKLLIKLCHAIRRARPSNLSPTDAAYM
jgi:hypothetical protein